MSIDLNWVNSFWDKIERKLSVTSKEIGINFPVTTVNGKYKPLEETNIYAWENGFWPGIMWLMYLATGDEGYREIAEGCEGLLDKALAGFEDLHHDVGFMWLTSAVADYKITGSEASRIRGMHAATILAGRFNPLGGYIRAWNDWGDPENNISRAIIDCMMNIQILFWASEDSKDPRFAAIAEIYADTVLKHFIRPDGSVEHMVVFDPYTGAVKAAPGGQGYQSGSSWSRGQAWAIYGFALTYLHTKKEEYLNAAKNVAHYFIANLDETGIPDLDFRAPKEPVLKDTSAGAIAACGLIELSGLVPELEKGCYLNAAEKILRALEGCCDFSLEEQSILQKCSGEYQDLGRHHIPLIYGDYFLTEALFKLKGGNVSFW